MREASRTETKKATTHSRLSRSETSSDYPRALFDRTNDLSGARHTWWEPERAPDVSAHSRARNDRQGKVVLIVEDESYLCDMISDVLRAEGHYTFTASNGLAALESLREFTPDIILLDLMMPIMDGWELLSVLGSDQRLSQIPVVIVTAIYDVRVTEQTTSAKAILTKPFDIERLAEVVRTYAA